MTECVWKWNLPHASTRMNNVNNNRCRSSVKRGSKASKSTAAHQYSYCKSVRPHQRQEAQSFQILKAIKDDSIVPVRLLWHCLVLSFITLDVHLSLTACRAMRGGLGRNERGRWKCRPCSDRSASKRSLLCGSESRWGQEPEDKHRWMEYWRRMMEGRGHNASRWSNAARHHYRESVN